MAILDHEQLTEALIAWINAQDRDLTVDLPNTIIQKLEKFYLRRKFHDDTQADNVIAKANEKKAFIEALKAAYPEISI